MKWEKKGLIYCPDGSSSWAKHSALTPTPILINNKIIRIYAGFRDEKGVSRVGYVDVEATNPSDIVAISKNPVLDVGVPGSFDDNGVILGDLIKLKKSIRMYYVGFQLVEKVKFLAFSGLAVSNNGGEGFSRYKSTPVMDRSDEGLFIRAIHSVMREGNKWKFWYSTGSGWQWIENLPYPQYHIKFIESGDGKTIGKNGVECINVIKKEYRIGRPRVYKFFGKYIMLFTKGSIDKSYLPGYAESIDGIHWTRQDNKIGIKLSSHGWDSQMLCYPALLKYEDTIYMFYNGNGMGKTGFGYAVLREW